MSPEEEARAQEQLVESLDRMRATAELLGPAYAEAAAAVHRFLDAWSRSVGTGDHVLLTFWDEDTEEAVQVTTGQLRALVDVSPTVETPDEEIGWHRRHALGEAERVRSRGPETTSYPEPDKTWPVRPSHSDSPEDRLRLRRPEDVQRVRETLDDMLRGLHNPEG